MEKLQHWVAGKLQVPIGQIDLKPITGDASSRRYYRFDLDGLGLLAVDSPGGSNDNPAFIDVAGRLDRAGIQVPDILEYDAGTGYFVIEDLGKDLYKDVLNKKSAESLFNAAFGVLDLMATQVDFSGLPEFGRSKIVEELSWVPDWYMTHHVSRSFSTSEQLVWQNFCDLLVDNALKQPQVFVHRDIHSCNLIFRDSLAPGVIDFQDAVQGPVTYDLISLIWDRYITWPRDQVEAWLEMFRRRVANDTDPEIWLKWCDLMGLQRNLKIIGIFARLAYRDQKKHYVDLMPRFAGYVLDGLGRYSELKEAGDCLEEYL